MPFKMPSSVASYVLMGCAAACTLIAGACADDPMPSGSESTTSAEPQHHAKLLARIERGSATLALYEPEPGVLVEVEQGKLADGATLAGDELGFAERYALLSGEASPQALVDAETRLDAVLPQPRGLAPAPITRAVPTNVGAHDKSSGFLGEDPGFIAKYCPHEDRFWGGLNLTGDSFWSENKLNYVKAGLYVVSGELSYHFSHTIAAIATDEDFTEANKDLHVRAGYYVGFRVKSTVNRSSSSRVSLAEGALYHHCVNYHF